MGQTSSRERLHLNLDYTVILEPQVQIRLLAIFDNSITDMAEELHRTAAASSSSGLSDDYGVMIGQKTRFYRDDP